MWRGEFPEQAYRLEDGNSKTLIESTDLKAVSKVISVREAAHRASVSKPERSNLLPTTPGKPYGTIPRGGRDAFSVAGERVIPPSNARKR